MKRFLILTATAFLLSGCLAHGHGHGHEHTTVTPPPWFFQKHHVTHDDHGHHHVDHHYTNRYGWTSTRPYYNNCNC